MPRLRLRRPARAAAIAAALAVVLGLGPPLSAPAAAEVDRDELADRVAAAFGARVLKIERGTLDGVAVLFVTMMREGGNDNAAFKVDTLAFDAESGDPLRAAVPQRRGADGLSGGRAVQTDMRPDVLRDRPWR